MPVSGKVLEDSIRLSKIRRIKLSLYVVQTGALVGLAFFVVLILGGARITPTLYLPLPSFIAVFVLLLLITCIESFFFRILEIRFARSSSARHLMAKNSQKRGVLIAVIAGIAALILAVPSILGVIEDAATDEVEVSALQNPPSFLSSDALGLISVTSVHVTAPQIVQIYIVSEDAYDDHKNDMATLYTLRINRPLSQYLLEEELTIRVPAGDYGKYYLILNDMDNPGTRATFTILKSVSNTFTGMILLFMVAMMVSNIAWVAYLIPIERKYSVGSIYK